MTGPVRTTFSWAVRGALATAGPGVGFVTLLLAEHGGVLPEALWVPAAIAVAAVVSLSAFVLDRARATARLLASIGLAAPIAIGPYVLLESPGTAFVIATSCAAATAAAWLAPLADVSPPAYGAEGRAVALRWSMYVSIGVWLALLIVERNATAAGAATAATCFGVTLGHAAAWAVSARGAHPVRAGVATAIVLIGAAAAIALRSHAVAAPAALAAACLAAVWVAPGVGAMWGSVIEHPARLLVATFAALSAAGAALLALPAAATDGESVGVLDAAFTSVSAVCVTGLIVLDTPEAFSLAGEAIIIALIQVGGLGIMTFYTAALSMLGRRLSLRHESAIAGALSIEDRGRLFNALARVLRVTFISEAIGAGLLFLLFMKHGHEPLDALWRGVFTSISAFCNAGFAIQSNSLIDYNQEPLVLHVVGVLIIVGGLSPVVMAALPAVAKRRPVSLQVRLVLTTSLVLLLFGFVAFATFEWSQTLDGLSAGDRLHNAWFQSLTTRTAGFNSIDTAAMRPATQTMTIALMFVGGAPGGTAGGIKVTTFAVLVLAVVAALRRQSDATAFARRVGHVSVYKAAAVMTIGVLAAVTALIGIQLTQPLDVGTAVFEVVSALATVGLSTGGTGMLDEVGKVIIIVCMFAGRVGPLTLFLFLTEHGFRSAWGYPEEEVDVG